MTATGTATGAETVLRVPGRTRRAISWAIIAAAVIAVALLGLRIAATAPALRDGLDPEGRGPAGARALSELLRKEGIDVVVARDRATTLAQLGRGATLAMADPYPLSDEGVLTLADAAETTVLLSASSRTMRILNLGSYADGGSDSAEPTCSLPEFAGVGRIRPGQLFAAAEAVTPCFGDGRAAAVLVADREGSRRAIVDGSRLLTNEHLAEDGNAALGVALLGRHAKVVWYVPSFDDSDIRDPDPAATLGALTPPWVSPVVFLLLTAGVVATFWRGRRFGPLVAESLPVTVRAAETMHGRARLTAQAADAAHAAQALREGSLLRVAARLSVPPVDATAVADTAAERIRTDRASLRDLFLGPLPTTDAGLVAYARRLEALENAVDDVARTERSTP